MRLLLTLIFTISLTQISYAADNWIIKTGMSSVSETVAKLEAIIERAPPSLMAKVDHGANAKKAGLDIGESVLLVLGAPKIGTPMMMENRLAGLDLPAKILVYSQNGETKIAYLDPLSIKQRYGLNNADKQVEMMSKALAAFTDRAAK